MWSLWYDDPVPLLRPCLTLLAQVRSLLTARASWSIKDGAYNGKDFIYSLARALSSDTPFMKSLMAWWNQYVLRCSHFRCFTNLLHL